MTLSPLREKGFLNLPKSKPFFAQALKNWLDAMAAEFSPIATWWP